MITDHLARWAALLAEPLDPDPLARRDPAYIAAELPLAWSVLSAWYAPEVRGLEHVPRGASLVVGTHNGGNLAPDMFVLMASFWRHHGADWPAYGLAHDLVFAAPPTARWIGKLGGVPASQANAQALLARGATVLVYPGGDLDAFKPARERHLVKFGRRSGFVRTAIAAGVPIVPVVSVGAHQTFHVLTDGRELAERLGLKRRFRVEVLPIFLCLPWGIFVGSYEGHLPVPSRVRIRVLPPIHHGLPPSAAEDPATVERLKEEVRATMQAALDELVQEGDFGPRAQLRAWLDRFGVRPSVVRPSVLR